MRHHALIACASLGAATAAFAGVIVIDGTAEALYGTAKEVQTIQTQFGDASLGEPAACNGSELDGAYAVVRDGFLYITLAGNLETNYNKLEVFIDSKAGGQNRLLGNNADVSFNGLNRMGDDGTGNGLTFDTGFAADYFVSVTCGFVVVNGTAEVTRDDEVLLVRENESVYLALGCVHRLVNPGKIPLALIEVQSGPYLGEDDIVRLEDVYGRG